MQTKGNRNAFTAAPLVLVMLSLSLCTSAASAAGLPYTLNPDLSLTGDCSTSETDLQPDPDCAGEPPAYPPPPDRPSARFNLPSTVAVDDWGNLYVASAAGATGRVDIFDLEGHFIGEFVAPNSIRSIAVDGEGNLYSHELIGGSTKEIVRYPPTTYNPAAGEIEYDSGTRISITINARLFNGLAIDRGVVADPKDDRLFVGQNKRVEIYSSASEGNTLKATIEGLEFSTTAAVDAQRNLLYTPTCKEGPGKCVVWVFEADAPYKFIKEIDGSKTPAKKFFSVQGSLTLAVDETNGHLFVGDLGARPDIFEFDENHEYVSTFAIPSALEFAVQSAVANNPKSPDPEDLNPDDNYRHLYVPYFKAAGNAFAFAPPQVTAPVITAPQAVGIGETEAELEALINPKQAETTYAIEYVTQTQFEIDEFESAQIAASGTLPAGATPKRVSAVLSGLDPGTAYRFLVTAENEIGPAVPKEASFATYNDANPNTGGSCPNAALRTGPSAALPDCRVYELVTPADTNGRAPLGAGFEGERFGQLQSSPLGEAVSFEILSGTLPGTEATGGVHGDPYVATRNEKTGWSSALVGPTGTQASKPKPGSFSPDQGFSFWTAEGTGSAVLGGATSYVHYPDGTSELIGRGSLGTVPRALGVFITEDGTHVIFETTNSVGSEIPLEPNAPAEGIGAVYDRTRDPITGDEETHVVSLLPSDLTPGAAEDATFAGASVDGEGIAFEIDSTLYLRVANETTHEIGTGVTFAGVSEGGERIFYLESGDLKVFDVATEKEITFADTAAAVVPVNVAPQGTRAYFVSEDAIPGANPEGDEAIPGEQNLYLSEEGEISFVATVTERDVDGVVTGTGAKLDGLGLWITALEERKPGIDPSRLDAAGGTLVFQARGELTDYDSGEASQVYRYDHAEETLACLSCPPTQASAGGGAALQSSASLDIAAPLSNFGLVPGVALNGERVFFESTEALVADDIDGLRDVYEWEEEGIGSCGRAGGCVYLISSGGSARDDYLFGHGQSGDDVLISTADILVEGDGNTTSIYDARVGGGFLKPIPPDCIELDQCRPSTPPPALPASESGPRPFDGNVAEKPKPKKCPKGKRKVKRKGKIVCVKKHKKKNNTNKRQGKANRGAAR